MDTEFEAKFYPVDKEAYRKKLQSIGAKLIIPERKMKRALADRLINKDLKCDYIRVRDEGNLIRLSAKTHARQDGKVSDQKELDVVVDSYGKMVEILEIMGLKVNRYQENLRETWNYKDAEIVIDSWPGLETYSEIEAKSEEEVKKIANELGLNWDKKIITGIAGVYSKVYGMSTEDAVEKLTYATFEKNAFQGLTKKWHGD